MKVVERYVDETSGREFKTKKEALDSENKSNGIKKLFSFWDYEKDEHCEFANGGWSRQRTKEEYERLQDALVEGVKKYEPWINEHYAKHGGINREYMGVGYIIGRFLSDGRSDLYRFYCLLPNICSKCYREWGQPYYANHCDHRDKIKKA